MSDVVTIVNLGHTQAGKTTLMAAMFAQMHQEGFAGFTLAARSRTDERYFLQLADGITNNNYPGPTAKRSEYRFVLQFNKRDLIEFKWADYRGGALGENSTDAQKRMLVEDLRTADGIMMLCDASEMAPNLIGRETPVGRKVSHMASLVNYALDKNYRTISLAIVLTKIDQLRVAKEKLLDPFGGYIETLAHANHVQAVFVPVGCGKDFLNVPMPLLFAIHVAVNNRESALSQSIAQLRSEVAQLQRTIAGLDTEIADLGRSIASLSSTADEKDAEHTVLHGIAEVLTLGFWESPRTKAKSLRAQASAKATQRRGEEQKRQEKMQVAQQRLAEQQQQQRHLQDITAALTVLRQQIDTLPRVNATKTQEMYVRQIAQLIDKPFRRRFIFNWG